MRSYIDIRGNDGLIPYEKAVGENKKELADYLHGLASAARVYSPEARNFYSENDVKAFVYQWFAGFDHQAEPDKGETYDLHVHQDWQVAVNPDRQFIITHHRARLIE